MRLLIRHVRKDYLIGEINNPQGSAVMICAYSLHRNGEYCDFGGGPVGFESVRHGSLFHEPLWSAARSTPFADLAHHEWLRDRMVIAECGRSTTPLISINNAVDFNINWNQ
ncbi:cytochrome P450 [Bradyrhizobium sp. CCGUVB23]|uniref:cytochrome P450 n=1 Tax=Bradyrhizobium sp. CCGUVB23 TaxID=2949630 RepID=UPI0020B1DB47|nr:cytochrome P450 [Bradyrhizobium sp. CCGUVB23]MCP3460950.1 cytochrome P450 [Bradyrhizobium sp. CCGUVB23]